MTTHRVEGARVRDLDSVAPVMSASAILRAGKHERRLTVRGSTGDYVRVTNRVLVSGRLADLSFRRERP